MHHSFRRILKVNFIKARTNHNLMSLKEISLSLKPSIPHNKSKADLIPLAKTNLLKSKLDFMDKIIKTLKIFNQIYKNLRVLGIREIIKVNLFNKQRRKLLIKVNFISIKSFFQV